MSLAAKRAFIQKKIEHKLNELQNLYEHLMLITSEQELNKRRYRAIQRARKMRDKDNRQ